MKGKVKQNNNCCGALSVCNKDSLLNSSNKIVYYHDQELDVLAGVLPINYNNDQLQMLRNVFYSLNENDVAGWIRSLQIRDIHLPINLREQALLIVGEKRIS